MATPEPGSGPTVAGALREATAVLTSAGIDNSSLDARLLLGSTLGVEQAELILRPERRLDQAERLHFDGLIARRLSHEPVSRILGQREFYGRLFRITPDTLDPRPDSETLIDAVLEIVDAGGGRQCPLRIIDIGTGTGCLLLTLLAELPAATGVGIDTSDAAVAVAKMNAGCLGLEGRSEFLEQAASEACDTFDIVVSNPPYIPSGDIAALAKDVRDFDPRVALDGGADGLDIYRQVAQRLGVLITQGWAFLEVGAGQAQDVSRLLDDALLQRIKARRVWRDLGGHERCVAVEIQR